MRTKVSVIMPSLNVAKYIEESVKSVINQTLKDIEIICVDAGSDDGTLEILQRLAKLDVRIKLVNSSQRSYGYQANLGINYAEGEYISIVETDDYIAPNMLEDLYSAGFEKDAEIVKGNYCAYWTQDDGERFFLKRNVCSDLYGGLLNPSDYSSTAEDDWYLWTGIYKKSFLQENNIYFNESKGAAFQDIGFLHLTNTYARKVLYVNNAFYFYCIDREDASSNSGKGLMFAYNEFKRLLDYDDANVKSPALFIRMARSFRFCVSKLNCALTTENREYCEAYNWLKNQLNRAIAQNIIGEFNIKSDTWLELQNMLDSLESYAKYKENLYNQIGNKIADKSVVIFGCGNYGYDAYKWLTKRKANIAAFMDNNSNFWGKKINGIDVLPPNKYADHLMDVFWVANEKHCDDIVKQLLSYGIQKDNIVHF